MYDTFRKFWTVTAYLIGVIFMGETFVHSVYMFNEVNDFINKENTSKSNFWGVENQFNVLDAYFALAMIKDEKHKSDLQEKAFEVAANELRTFYSGNLSRFKKRTAIIIEHAARDYVLKVG